MLLCVDCHQVRELCVWCWFLLVCCWEVGDVFACFRPIEGGSGGRFQSGSLNPVPNVGLEVRQWGILSRLKLCCLLQQHTYCAAFSHA